jgi:hypothetical protein
VASARLRPEFTTKWSIVDADAKLAVVIELVMSSSEAAARSLLDAGNAWTARNSAEYMDA